MPFLLIDQAPAFRQHDRSEAIVTQQRNLAVKSGSARAAIKSRQAAGETVIECESVRVRLCNLNVPLQSHACEQDLGSGLQPQLQFTPTCMQHATARIMISPQSDSDQHQRLESLHRVITH